MPPGMGRMFRLVPAQYCLPTGAATQLGEFILSLGCNARLWSDYGPSAPGAKVTCTQVSEDAQPALPKMELIRLHRRHSVPQRRVECFW